MCLQIGTTLLVAPAIEHQMSLHLSSAISHSGHLSLRPAIALPLRDPPISMAPQLMESLSIHIDAHVEMKRLGEEEGEEKEKEEEGERVR